MFAAITRRLSYANIAATIAIFLALTGGAYAALTLPKHSVGTKNIKPHAVKHKQLGKNAVGTGNLKKKAVSGAKVKGNTLTGAQINESKLGKVPKAADADTVDGSLIKQISYRVAPGGSPQTLFSLDGLTVTAECVTGQTEVILDATTDTNGSIIGLSDLEGVDDVFDVGEHQIAPLDDYAGVLSYGRGASGSPVVTANFIANRFGNQVCSVVGTVIAG